MYKEIHTIRFNYQKTDHHGAPYTIDGEHFLNYGQLVQIARISVKTGQMTKPDNIRYDLDSDLSEYGESIKSAKATLVNMYLGDDLESVLNTYKSTTHSQMHSWCDLKDNELTAYVMDIDEFIEFTRLFGRYDHNRKVVRYKTHSSLMVKWFESLI